MRDLKSDEENQNLKSKRKKPADKLKVQNNHLSAYSNWSKNFALTINYRCCMIKLF